MALVSTGEASTLVRPVSNIAGPPPRASEHDFAPLLQLRSTLGAVVPAPGLYKLGREESGLVARVGTRRTTQLQMLALVARR